MDKMLKKKKTRYQLAQEETEHWNCSIPIPEIESAIQNFPTKRMLATDGFCGSFYHIHKEEIINIIHKLFHKREVE